MTEILPCICGAESKLSTFRSFVYCPADNCRIVGPNNDPTGEKWNRLVRRDAPSAPKPGTVRVKIPVWVCDDGRVDVHCTISDYGTADHFHPWAQSLVWILADLPQPKTVEVQGVVDAREGGE